MAVVGLACLFLATEHFTHRYQPRGIGKNISGYDHISGPTLAEVPRREFHRRSGETNLAYVKRMTMLVHLATYHCAPTDHRLSFIETALEKVMSGLRHDPQFAFGLIERKRLRCGFCSERATVLADILRESDFEASALGLEGHVATLVVVGGIKYLADPDYGVGPYRYGLTESELRRIYLSSSIPELTNLVVPMVANRTDDAPYYSMEFFDNLKTIRDALFLGSNILAIGLTVIGLALLFVPAVALGKSYFRTTPIERAKN
jgi:hypothetical protein